MKLVWSPETASKAYIDTVQSCKKFKDSGVAELLAAMAAGWNAKVIVEWWVQGGPIATSVGLAVAARNTGGRHVCVVADEGSRAEYRKAMMREMGAPASASPEVVVGEEEAGAVMEQGVDFLVVDCRRRDFTAALRVAKVSPRGGVLACKNACLASFPWPAVLGGGNRLVRSVFLPVGKGLDIAYVGRSTTAPNKRPSRWVKHIDRSSGEEHLFRQ